MNAFSSVFYDTLVEECGPQDDSPWEECVITKYKSSIKPRIVGSLYDVYKPPKYLNTHIRSITLLYKLRNIIRTFRLNRRSNFNSLFKQYCRIDNVNPIYVMPESDSVRDDKGEMPSTIVTTENVTLVETQQSSPENKIEHYLPNFWQDVSSSDVKDDYSALTSRFIEVTSFTWNKDDYPNKYLVDIDLPTFLLSMDSGGACDRPNTIPFKVNMLAKYDLEIKIQLNAQKFQIGQLLCAWYYFPQFDEDFQNRFNLASLSQTRHELITANVSNEVTIYVPYVYYSPFIRTRDRDDMPEANNLGKLIISVLNPLTVSTTGAPKCYGTVWCRFVNAVFSGTISGTLGTASGINCVAESVFSNVMGGAVRGLMTSLVDQNRDNPPNPQAPMYVVPHASHSWSAGTGIQEPLQSLRLDVRGQKPYLDNCTDEMSINYVTSQYGFIKTLIIDKDMLGGRLVESFEASPMMNKRHYIFAASDEHNLRSYALPPIAVVSNLFNYWRGSLKFRFDFVYSNVGHNARFMIAYIPGIKSDTPVSLVQAKSSPHVIISLGETQSYTYEIPFVSHRPFWSRNYTGNFDSEFVEPPSMIYFFILNPLIPMESVSSQMYVNVWMSAGNDFEVAVPIQPNIGLSFNRQVIYADSMLVHALEGYYPYYAGNYYRANNSTVLVMRHATTSGASALFVSKFLRMATKGKVYYYEAYDRNEMPKFKLPNGNMILCKWGVVLQTEENGDYIMVLCENETNAVGLAKYMVDKRIKTVEDAVISRLAIKTTNTTDNTWSSGNPAWIVHEYRYTGFEGPDKVIVSSDLSLGHTQNGLLLFGERFLSLKDLSRRYQLYSSFVVDVSNVVPGQCSVVVPLMMQGLDLNLGNVGSINEISNRCRDGHIPIIASGYRVGSGSLRFRLVVPCQYPIGIWIQHRPDRGLRMRSSTMCKEIITAEAVSNHTYSSYIQMTNVNGIIEFEVPYYVPGPFVMLQKPSIVKTDDKYFYSLGEMAIGFVFNKKSLINLSSTVCTLFYSLADDARFSLFQGFTPMVLLDDISDVTSAVEVFPEGPISYLKNMVGEQKKEVIKDLKQTVVEELEPFLSAAEQKALDLRNKIQCSTGIDLFKSPLIRTLIDKLVHITISPTLGTILWSVVSILIEIGFTTISFAQKFIEAFQNFLDFFRRMTASASKEPNAEGQIDPIEVTPEGPPSEETPVIGLLTLMWTALCSVLSYVGRKPKDIAGFAKFLTADMKTVFQSGNSLFTFLRNILSTFKMMYEWIIRQLYPEYASWKEFDSSYEEIKNWCEEVCYLTDPSRVDDIFVDGDLIERVTLAYDVGCIYLSQIGELSLANNKSAGKVGAVLKEQFKNITKLYQDCHAMGIDSHIRKSCFTICMYGEPGIGKSFISSEVCAQMLKIMNISIKGPMICVVNPTDKYWSQCSRQPVLMMDDLWAVEAGDMLLQQIAMINSVCSPVPLTPPMAELSDKKMRYNPEIFWYNTNKPYPIFDRVDKYMLWRRRDFMVEVRHIDFETESKLGCEHCIKKIRPQDLTSEQFDLLSDFHHIRFCIKKNVMDPNEVSVNWITYSGFIIAITTAFKDNRIREMKRFEKELERYTALRDDIVISSTPLSEKILKIRETAIKFKMNISSSTFFSYLDHVYDTFRHDSLVALQHYLPFTKFINILSGSLREIKESYGKDISPFLNEIKPEAGEEEINLEDVRKVFRLDAELPDCSRMDFKSIERVIQKFRVADEVIVSQDETDVIGCLMLVHGWREKGIITKKMLEEFVFSISCEVNKVMAEELIVLMRLNEIAMQFDERRFIAVRRFVDWYQVYGNIICFQNFCRERSLGFQGVSSPGCRHKDCFIQHIDWNSTLGWTFRGEMYDFSTCDTLFCPYRLTLFQRAIMRQWLEVNPLYKSLYRQNKMHRLPQEFRCNKYAFPDMLTWKSVCGDMIKRFRKFFSDGYDRLGQFFDDHYLLFINTVSVLFLGLSAFSIYKGCTDPAKKGLFSQWQAESAYGVNLGKAPHAAQIPAFPQSDSQQYEVALLRLKKNFVTLTVKFDDKVISYRCLIIKGRTMLIIRHFDEEIRSLPSSKRVFVKVDNINWPYAINGLQIDYDSIVIKWYNNVLSSQNTYPSNFGLMELPIMFPEFKSIISLIASKADHMYAGGHGTLYTGSMAYSDLVIKRDNKRPYVVKSNGIISSIFMDDVYTYRKHGKGLCGSVLLCSSMQSPIIGIHVAGVDGLSESGISECIVREMFDSVVSSGPYKQFVAPVLEPIDISKVDLNTAIFPYGCVTGKYVHRESGKSQIIPSPIHGVFPVTMEPNPLRVNDKRLPFKSNPLYLGVEHKGKPPLDFNCDILDECAKDLEIMILSNVVSLRSQVGVVSLNDVVCGNVNVKYFDSLVLSTSAGHPLSSIISRGKTELFDIQKGDDNFYYLNGMHPELSRIYNLDMNLRVRGIKPFTVFVDCLKDDCLPIEKCKIPGKTRIFSISPVQFTIAFKQYCLDFMASYQNCRLDAEHGIGINAQSLEWTELTSRLLKNSSKIVTGDYKNFGPSLMKICVQKACDIILKWYEHNGAEKQHLDILSIMFQEIQDAAYLCEDLVYYTACGIPSGSPITTPLNSLVNCLYIRYAYRILTNLDFASYRENIVLYTYGDDIIMSVKDHLIDIFNTETISRVFSEYNIVFTDQDKSLEVVKYRGIDTATFLRRLFCPHPTRAGLWVGLLAKESIENCCNYISRKGDHNENILQNASMACELAVEWGEEYYDYVGKSLIKQLSNINLKFRYEPWRVLEKKKYAIP